MSKAKMSKIKSKKQKKILEEKHEISTSKYVRGLIIGDPHFMKNNVMECNRFTESLIKIAKEKKPDMIVVMGDMLNEHEKVDIGSHNAIETLIDGLSKIAKTFMLIGNHDYADPNNQFLSSKHIFGPFKKWENVRVVDYPIIEKVKNKMFTFCPYVPPGRFVEALSKTIECGEMWEMSDAVFGHQEIRGCVMENGNISTKGDVWDENYPFLFLGHIHKAQKIGENGFCVGSSRQVNFGELDDKGVYLVTFRKKNPVIEKLELECKKKVVIEMNVSEMEDFDKSLYKDNLVKIKVQGESHQIKVFKKSKLKERLETDGITLNYDIIVPNSVPNKPIVFEAPSGAKFMDIVKELIKVRSPAIQDEFRFITGEVIIEEVNDSDSCSECILEFQM